MFNSKLLVYHRVSSFSTRLWGSFLPQVFGWIPLSKWLISPGDPANTHLSHEPWFLSGWWSRYPKIFWKILWWRNLAPPKRMVATHPSPKKGWFTTYETGFRSHLKVLLLQAIDICQGWDVALDATWASTKPCREREIYIYIYYIIGTPRNIESMDKGNICKKTQIILDTWCGRYYNPIKWSSSYNSIIRGWAVLSFSHLHQHGQAIVRAENWRVSQREIDQIGGKTLVEGLTCLNNIQRSKNTIWLFNIAMENHHY